MQCNATESTYRWPPRSSLSSCASSTKSEKHPGEPNRWRSEDTERIPPIDCDNADCARVRLVNIDAGSLRCSGSDDRCGDVIEGARNRQQEAGGAQVLRAAIRPVRPSRIQAAANRVRD